MAYSDAQRRASYRYIHSGHVARVEIVVASDTLDTWQSYAQSRGMVRADMIRDCVRRCMALDGWTSTAGDTARATGGDTDQHSNAATCGDGVQVCDVATCGDVAQPARTGTDPIEQVPPAPVKRKRGRPRKQPPALDTIDAQPVQRKRGRPRKVQP